MNNKILCIIDMQPSFSASQKIETIQACQLEIKDAIAKGHYIFFVEWENEGSTDKRLTSLAIGYDKSYHVYKRQNDGSSHIMTKVYSLGIINSKFKICGVNTDACVKATVIGLSEHGRLGRPCEVVGKACNTDWGNNFGALKILQSIPNVTVI